MCVGGIQRYLSLSPLSTLALTRWLWCIERLYAIEHPKLVQAFDNVDELDGDTVGYWISKRWIKGKKYNVHPEESTHKLFRRQIGDCWDPKCTKHSKRTLRQTHSNTEMMFGVNMALWHWTVWTDGGYLLGWGDRTCGLALNINSTTPQGGDVLKNKFPLWEPLRGDAEPCAICDTLVHISKEDQREWRRRAEEEKVHQEWCLINTAEKFYIRLY